MTFMYVLLFIFIPHVNHLLYQWYMLFIFDILYWVTTMHFAAYTDSENVQYCINPKHSDWYLTPYFA